MKVIAKPVEMVAWFDMTGIPHPVRLRLSKEDESVEVINIEKVITVDKEKLAGNEMLAFRCQSVINNTKKLLEIKYELRTCKWILFKM